MIRIRNGGIELAILKALPEDELTEKDKARLNYLDGLPKNTWIALDSEGRAISRDEEEQIVRQKIKTFKAAKNGK